jgi:hypothetical protein
MKRGGGEQMGRELSEMGKWSGVAGEVQFIGAQTGADTRGGGGLADLQLVQNQWFDSFPIEIKFSIASI